MRNDTIFFKKGFSMKDYSKKTLCKLIKKDFIKDNIADYSSLVKDAVYVCMKCGRVAKDKKNLCKPQKISS